MSSAFTQYDSFIIISLHKSDTFDIFNECGVVCWSSCHFDLRSIICVHLILVIDASLMQIVT